MHEAQRPARPTSAFQQEGVDQIQPVHSEAPSLASARDLEEGGGGGGGGEGEGAHEAGEQGAPAHPYTTHSMTEFAGQEMAERDTEALWAKDAGNLAHDRESSTTAT
jgi:hypothetical protein